MALLRNRFGAALDRSMAVVAIIFFTTFAWKHVRYLLTSTIQFDDAFIANVAKNLAEGHGYSASYYGFQPFHLEITTGPTIVLPAAAMIRLFGNAYWVPTAAYIVLIAALIVELLALVHRRLPTPAFTTTAALIAIGLFAFGAQEIGLLGEVPAALLTAIAALTLVRNTREWRAPAAGIVLGAAILAKAVAALAVPAFLVAIAAAPLFESRRLRSGAEFLVGLALPIVAFETWKLGVIGSVGGWSALFTNEMLDVAGPNALSGSGILQAALSDPTILIRNGRRNLIPLLAWWGGTRNPVIAPIWFGGRLPAALATIAVSTTFGWALRHYDDEELRPTVLAGTILIGAGMTSFLWWLLFSPTGWPRHAQPGLIRTLIGCSLVIGSAVRRRATLPAISAALLVLALAPNAFELRDPINPFSDFYDDLRYGPQPTTRLRSLLATVDFVHGLEAADPSARLLGCGWSHNPSLEFLLPGADHFRDCIEVRTREVQGRRLILVRGEYFNQRKLPDIRQFQEWCERRILFRRLAWVVSECEGPPPGWK